MSQYRSNLCLFPASVFPNKLPLKNYAEDISLCMMTRLMSLVLSFVTSSIKQNPTFFISFLLIILVFSWLFLIFKRTGLCIQAFPWMGCIARIFLRYILNPALVLWISQILSFSNSTVSLVSSFTPIILLSLFREYCSL